MTSLNTKIRNAEEHLSALQAELADAALADDEAGVERLEAELARAEQRSRTLQRARQEDDRRKAQKLAADRAAARTTQINTAARRHREVVKAAKRYSEAIEAATQAWHDWQAANDAFVSVLPPDGKTPDALVNALAGGHPMRHAAEDEAYRIGGVIAGAPNPEARLPGVQLRPFDVPSEMTPLSDKVSAAGKALLAQLRQRQQ